MSEISIAALPDIRGKSHQVPRRPKRFPQQMSPDLPQSQHPSHRRPSPSIPLTLSILPTAFSNLSNLPLLSTSLFSNTSTLCTNLALTRLSSATISFACVNRLALKSSISLCVCTTFCSALCLRARSVASWVSSSRSREVGAVGGWVWVGGMGRRWEWRTEPQRERAGEACCSVRWLSWAVAWGWDSWVLRRRLLRRRISSS